MRNGNWFVQLFGVIMSFYFVFLQKDIKKFDARGRYDAKQLKTEANERETNAVRTILDSVCC
jgi:hypothetical protein